MVDFHEGSGQITFENTEQKEELKGALQCIRREQTENMLSLKEKVERYEKKRQSEEALYQSRGKIGKWLTRRRPDHHQAVEYMVYVKRPLQEIDEIQANIKRIEEILKELETDNVRISIPHFLSNELKKRL